MPQRDKPPKPGQKSPPLEASLGYHLYRAHAMMRDRFASAISEFGVNPPEWAVLASIGRCGCSTAAEISNATGRDKAGIARSLRSLEAKGLVRRSEAPADGRAMLLRLTPTGSRILPKLEHASRSVNQAVLSTLDPTDRKKLIQLLQQINDG